MSYYKHNKCCAVPQCPNTLVKTPEKLFISVPPKERKTWLQLAGRDSGRAPLHMYFCEDHFDLPKDMENYRQYTLMGRSSVSKIRMKPGCLPMRFACQIDRKIPTKNVKTRPLAVKRQKLRAKERETEQVNSAQNVTTAVCQSGASSETPNSSETLDPHCLEEGTFMETANENSNDASENSSNDIKPEPMEEQYLEDDLNLDDIKIEVEENPILSQIGETENVPVFKPCTRQILPKINMFSIVEYLVENNSFKEIDYKNLKTEININAEDTIGYVQLHTIEDKVTLQGTVAFDRDTSNVCIVKYDSLSHNICYTNCECQQPACHHVLAFLMWLHRRSEEQLDNDMSYYIEPIVQQTTFLKAKDIVYDSDETDTVSEDLTPQDIDQIQENIVREFVKTCKELKMYNSPLYRHLKGNELLSLSLHHMIASWRNDVTPAPAPATARARTFLHYCTDRMAERESDLAELATTEDNTIRQELQYGRLEAQHIFEICLLPSEQVSGVESEKKELIDAILNPDLQEDDKFKENLRITLEDQLNIKINKCGIIISEKYPMFCAVPYGFTDTHTVDIVCLENEDQITDYLESNVFKPQTQLRLQLNMLLAKKEKAYFFIGLKELQKTKRIFIPT